MVPGSQGEILMDIHHTRSSDCCPQPKPVCRALCFPSRDPASLCKVQSRGVSRGKEGLCKGCKSSVGAPFPRDPSLSSLMCGPRGHVGFQLRLQALRCAHAPACTFLPPDNAARDRSGDLNYSDLLWRKKKCWRGMMCNINNPWPGKRPPSAEKKCCAQAGQWGSSLTCQLVHEPRRGSGEGDLGQLVSGDLPESPAHGQNGFALLQIDPPSISSHKGKLRQGEEEGLAS